MAAYLIRSISRSNQQVRRGMKDSIADAEALAML
jgi:hypothetical protein